jgi:hypothetical protein
VTYTPTTPGAPLYPNVFATMPDNIPRSAVNVSIMPSKVNVPTSAQLIATIEHALGPRIALTGSVIYTKSWYKEFTYDTNLQWDPTSSRDFTGQRWFRPDPQYRSINQIRFEAPAEYEGAFIEVSKRGGIVGFESNLTVARSRQSPLASSGINGTINDQLCGIMCDYGPAPDVPTVRGLVSVWYNVYRNLQLSGIFRARTGLAVDPNAAGLDLNNDQKFGDRTPGLVPYSFRQPGTHTLDFRAAWSVPLPKTKLQIYVESFNLLNTANIALVNNNYGANAAQPLASWMTPQLYFPPREIQLGARLTF